LNKIVKLFRTLDTVVKLYISKNGIIMLPSLNVSEFTKYSWFDK